MNKVLITGGTGLLGKNLCKLLQEKGFEVAILSRNLNTKTNYKSYYWRPEKREIDPKALENTDYIIHLAGANISEKPWTESRKKEIIDSRVDSANLIFETLKKNQIQIKAFISASGVGYYGNTDSDQEFTEKDTSGNDFLAQTCVLWEQAADNFASKETRVVKVRTGIILEKNGGILGKLKLPTLLCLSAPFGSGKQIIPWIHIDDICQIYLKAIEDKNMNGAYNAVAPEVVSNRIFVKRFAKALKRPLFMPALPAFLLKWIFGEMSVIFLKGNKISAEKVSKTGYQFKFSSLNLALSDLY